MQTGLLFVRCTTVVVQFSEIKCAKRHWRSLQFGHVFFLKTHCFSVMNFHLHPQTSQIHETCVVCFVQTKGSWMKWLEVRGSNGD